MIDQLAIDYADQNIVYVEYTWPEPILYRWNVIERTEPGFGLTWAMVDSGQMHSREVGTEEEAVEKYTALTEYAISQEALADIKAEYWIEDDMAYFKATVTNLSDVDLSSENDAMIHAFIKETGIKYEDTNMSHHASRGEGMTKIVDLKAGESGTFYIPVPLKTITNWENIEAVVFVDYETEPWGRYDQLNAAYANGIGHINDISVDPQRITITIPNILTELAPVEVTVSGTEGINWTATPNVPWVSISRTTGTIGDTITIDFDETYLRATVYGEFDGANNASVLIKDDASDSFTSVEILILVEEKLELPLTMYLPIIINN